MWALGPDYVQVDEVVLANSSKIATRKREDIMVLIYLTHCPRIRRVATRGCASDREARD